MENPKLISSIHGISAIRGQYTDRVSHAFIFKLSGASRYDFWDRSILLSEGEVLFIPKGETYTVRKVSDGESRYAVLNFQAGISDGRPEKYVFVHRSDFDRICAGLRGQMTQDTPADRYRAMGLFYEILAHICDTAKQAYRPSRELERIEPAVKVLRASVFDPDLRIGTLHTLCGLSDTYFRKIFLARYGTTPRKYVLDKRLSHAKAILDNGEYNSIAEVALLCGFEDPLYFSKVFRQRYGHPPSRQKEKS